MTTLFTAQPVPSRTEAWAHQREAFWFARDLPAAMLAMDMGTGKSKVAVDLVIDRRARRTLILCPKAVVGVWPREFALHALEMPYVVAPRKGTVAKRTDEILVALERDEPVVVVVNYESAWRQPMRLLLLGTEWDAVILDESARVKSPGGKASRFCAQLRERARTRLCLTGTPMPHSPLDIYAQYRFLEPSIYGTSFVAFRSRYAVMGGYENRQVVRHVNQDDLAERMYRIAFRVMADDVLDLPEVVHVQRTTVLEPKARRVYENLSRQLFAEVDAGTVTAANALVRLLRLQQATSGHAVLDDDGANEERTVVEVGTEKRDLLADTLEDLPAGERVIVFCRFTHDLNSVRWVAEKQGRAYGELSGRRRDALADDATMAPDVEIAGVQIQSGGVGIDLTAARYCVFYSVGFALGDYTQALRRVHRPGQAHPVTYFHLLVEDSIDAVVYAALERRLDLVEYVLSQHTNDARPDTNVGAPPAGQPLPIDSEEQ